jgi:hypothetical protein
MVYAKLVTSLPSGFSRLLCFEVKDGVISSRALWKTVSNAGDCLLDMTTREMIHGGVSQFKPAWRLSAIHPQ